MTTSNPGGKLIALACAATTVARHDNTNVQRKSVVITPSKGLLSDYSEAREAAPGGRPVLTDHSHRGSNSLCAQACNPLQADSRSATQNDRPKTTHIDQTDSSFTTDLTTPNHGDECQQVVAKNLSSTKIDAGSTADSSRKGKQRISMGQNSRRYTLSRARRKVPQGMQAQWRVGAAPSVALAMIQEESQISKVLSQAAAFHTSMSEVFWTPRARSDPFIFDIDSRVEIFRDSSVVAACLVAVDKSTSARKCLDQVLPGMDDLLRSPPPSLYLILAELSLGLVKTPNNALRTQITEYLAKRALAILGADHPITGLLRLRLPQSQKEVLGGRLWEAVLPILARGFGAEHYQFSTQVFCQARNLASCGRLEEAVQSIEALLDMWGSLYGNNSLIVCYAKIELANILIAAGMDTKAELVVSDALRTSDVIHAAELKDEDCSATEKRHREASIAFPRIAGLRTLGKLHAIRRNLGAATYHYSQAVAIGRTTLGADNAAVELAQHDLDLARRMELAQSLRQLSTNEYPSLTNIVASPTR